MLKRFGSFIILAALAFALGALAAYVMQPKQASEDVAKAAKVQVEQAVEKTLQAMENGEASAPVGSDGSAAASMTMDENGMPEIAITAPEATAQSDAAMSEAAHDVAGDDAHAMAEEATTQEAPVEETTATEAVTEAAPAPAEETQAAPAAQAVAGVSVGGAFALTDHNGAAVTQASWPGKYKLVFFGFTHCPEICPVAMEKVTAALNAMGDDAQKLQTLFITVDPERDTAETLKTFLGNYHASIVGLTGSEDQIRDVKSAYKVYAAKAEGGDAENYILDHSSYTFLMSPDDALLLLFRTEDTAEAMAEKISAELAKSSAPAETPAVEEQAPAQ